MPRPRLHDDQLRDRLLEIAAATVSADGVQALSVRKLAAAADTSTAAVYSLFGGKPSLVRALYENAFQQLGVGQAAVGESDDPLEDIVQLGIAYRATAVADPNGYQVMFGDGVSPADVGRKASRAAGRTFEPLVRAVRRGVRAGRLPAKPKPDAIALALWANVHGLVSLELGEFTPPGAGDPATIFETAVRANVAGWTTLS